MTRLPLSAAAGALLRALLCRTGIPRNRILLSEVRSVDWQSLTFVGERHEIDLRVAEPGADAIVNTLTNALAEQEFAIDGQIVADIQLVSGPSRQPDGSIAVRIEALTIAEH